MGRNTLSGRYFNSAVAFEKASDTSGQTLGRAVAQSTFDHVCDYNWDPGFGRSAFVSEAHGDGMTREPQALKDIHTYVRNVAAWLTTR